MVSLTMHWERGAEHMADRKLKGGLFNGIASSLYSALVFMIMPIVFILFFIGVINVAVADLGTDLPQVAIDAIDEVIAGMEAFMFNVIVYAIPIVVVAFPLGFFKKGSFLRLLFGLAQVPLIALWLYYITGGGILQVDISGISPEAYLPEGLPLAFALTGVLEMDMSGLFFILMALIFAKGAVHIAEFGGNRGRYLRSKHKGDDDDYETPSKTSKKRRDDDWEYL